MYVEYIIVGKSTTEIFRHLYIICTLYLQTLKVLAKIIRQIEEKERLF